MSNLSPELIDLSIEFAPGPVGIVDLTVRGVRNSYGHSMKLKTQEGTEQVKCFEFNGKSCPAPMIDGKVKLRVLADRASVEIYANDGATVASAYEFEIPQDRTLSMSAHSEVRIHSLTVHELNSAWPSES